MAVRIAPDSSAGMFLKSLGVPDYALASTTFRVLNLQLGDALTVIWPGGRPTVFIKGRFLERDTSGGLPVGRNLPLIRHELYHVEQGREWGFIGYWARHLWARVRHLSVSARSSSVEAPAYDLQRAAHAALDRIEAGEAPTAVG